MNFSTMQIFPKFIDQQHGKDDEHEKPTEEPFFCEYYDVYECKSCKPVIKQCDDLHYTHVNSCYALWTQSKNQSKSVNKNNLSIVVVEVFLATKKNLCNRKLIG